MTKAGYAAVLVTVIGIHWYLLHYHVPVKKIVAKPDAKIYHITLSRVSVKKPPPPQIPPAPQIEPVTPPAPTLQPPKPRPKKKHVKKVRKKRKMVKKELPKPPQKKRPAPVPKVARQHAKVAVQNTATIRDRYIALIRKKIAEHLYYPRIARRMRMQGEVEVAFTVDAAGKVSEIQVIHAPKTILANAAIKTLQSLDLPPIPAALHRQRLQLSIPIEFKLHKGTS